MRLLIKWSRRLQWAGSALLRGFQLGHAFAWLRDRFDDFDNF